jgi:hypothetical protein
MGKKKRMEMTRILKRVFINNWPRKLFSLILAIIIYFTISQSMTSSRTISSIPVRIINLKSGKTVEGIDSSGIMKKRVSLTLTGNKSLLDDVNPNDLEIELDASGKPDEWVAETSKRNLISLNPDTHLSRMLKKVSSKNIVIRSVKLVKEQVPVVITQPIGQAPKGYHFLDIWPYHINTTISGPEDVVRKIKSRGLKLTFNLHNITRRELDTLSPEMRRNDTDVITYRVPDAWKQLTIPSLSPSPVMIDDPTIKNLRIDFLRYETLPLGTAIPVSLYFPLKNRFSPNKISLGNSDLLTTLHGIKALPTPLLVRGVSALFLEIVKNHLEIAIIVNPKDETSELDWSVQFINAGHLEDRYVSSVLQDVTTEEMDNLSSTVREEHIRNRFRNYMNRFTLIKPNFEKLNLLPILDMHKVIVKEVLSDDA